MSEPRIGSASDDQTVPSLNRPSLDHSTGQFGSSPEKRPHQRLSPDLNPVNSRVLYWKWHTTENRIADRPGERLYDGIILEYNSRMISTKAGVLVPEKVHVAELLPDLPTGQPLGQPRTMLWIGNPYYSETILPPSRNFLVWYLSENMELLQTLEVEDNCWSVADDVQERLLNGRLWTGSVDVITLSNVAIVHWCHIEKANIVEGIMAEFDRNGGTFLDSHGAVSELADSDGHNILRNYINNALVQHVPLGFGTCTR